MFGREKVCFSYKREREKFEYNAGAIAYISRCIFSVALLSSTILRSRPVLR